MSSPLLVKRPLKFNHAAAQKPIQAHVITSVSGPVCGVVFHGGYCYVVSQRWIERLAAAPASSSRVVTPDSDCRCVTTRKSLRRQQPTAFQHFFPLLRARVRTLASAHVSIMIQLAAAPRFGDNFKGHGTLEPQLCPSVCRGVSATLHHFDRFTQLNYSEFVL